MNTTVSLNAHSGTHVNGTWSDAGSTTFVVDDPATGDAIASVVESGPEDADAALAAAHDAFPSWAATPARTRSDILRRAYDRVREHADELAGLIVAEAGKRLTDARAEVGYAAEFLRWYSEEAVRIPSRYCALPEGGGTMYVSRRAVGPCLLLTPWNFPLAMVTRKVAPALAAGCTAVIKPSELTPLTCFRFVDIFVEAGVPPGVVNVITTTDPAPIVEQLLADVRLRKVSFTGSTAVGGVLMRQATGRMIRTSMELGGDAPLLVLDDADVHVAVEGTLTAKFRGGGQACTAANRILVAASVADEYVGRLAERVEAIHAGPGYEPSSGIGPLISAKAVEQTRARVELASDRLEVVAQGTISSLPGYYYAASLLLGSGVEPSLAGVEWFAPVAVVSVFDDEECLVAHAATSDAGLASYIFSRDIQRARRITGRLEVGMTAINTGLLSNAAAPFGGVKLSGHGREGGPEGLDAYMETHYLLEH